MDTGRVARTVERPGRRFQQALARRGDRGGQRSLGHAARRWRGPQTGPDARACRSVGPPGPAMARACMDEAVAAAPPTPGYGRARRLRAGNRRSRL